MNQGQVMSPEIISGVLIVLSFVAGVLVGAHNAKTVNADLAVAKNDIANLKTTVASLVSNPAAPAAPGPTTS